MVDERIESQAGLTERDQVAMRLLGGFAGRSVPEPASTVGVALCSEQIRAERVARAWISSRRIADGSLFRERRVLCRTRWALTVGWVPGSEGGGAVETTPAARYAP
jgi:hypothetical protein